MPHEGLSSLLQMRGATPNNMVLAKQTLLCPSAAGLAEPGQWLLMAPAPGEL